MNRTLIIILLLIISSCLAQKTLLEQDPRTEALITQGKRFMQTKAYASAAQNFEEAAARPFSHATTAAIYLAGLAYYYEGDDFFASQRFNTILEEYPKSKYVEDAKYHNGLIQVESDREENQSIGIEALFQVWEKGKDRNLSVSAKNAILQNLFYDVDLRLIDQLYHRSVPKRKTTILEAWCYRLVQTGQTAEAQTRYVEYLTENGAASPYLDRMLAEVPTMTNKMDPDIIKIALFLPLDLEDPRTVYGKTLPASGFVLEYYEGIRKAIETYSQYSHKKIFLRVFDTRNKRDTLLTIRHLETMEQMPPDVIIGDIYNFQSEVISKWAEAHATPQIVPLSPAKSLTLGKDYIFLAHPSLETHGVRMAEYAVNELNLQKVAIWTDLRSTTELMTEGFIRTMESYGREVMRIEIDSTFEEGADDQIPGLVRSMASAGIDGVYLPIVDNQETSNLILSKMSYDGIEVAVMGSPHWWKRYNIIDRDLKESYNLLFTTTSMIRTQSPEYRSFYNEYLREYGFPPEDFAIQGYDLGMYLIKMLDIYDYSAGVPLTTHLRTFPAFESIHLNYYFGGSQSNQMVNIGQFREGGVVNVNRE